MVHDPELLDRLDGLPKHPFGGQIYRATRLSLDPLAASYNGGRWMPPDSAAILYTSLERSGALAEIAYHWGLLTPLPTKPVVVHRLKVKVHRTLRLIRGDIASLGVTDAEYLKVNLPRTQAIGAAVEFLGCDGLLAPSARWDCENLMLFPDRMSANATLDLVDSETVDWITWAKSNNLLPST